MATAVRTRGRRRRGSPRAPRRAAGATRAGPAGGSSLVDDLAVRGRAGGRSSLYPVVATLYYSLTNFQAGSYRPVQFVGAAQLPRLFTESDDFWVVGAQHAVDGR